ncbi:hypothetical protein Leryth_013354 [Lithospermum erythrorhizon]|nr:hypothetical protein Leryth_013354 [Lithospermum erythrorhizon]
MSHQGKMQLPEWHAILLGEDGKINQTFKADSNNQRFLLTFTMSLGGQSCVANASLIVSAPDSEFHFSLKQNYSKGHWDSYGHQLGSWGGAEEKNLVLQSEAIDIDPNSLIQLLTRQVKAVDPTLNGEFVVGVYAGSSTQNFSIQSAGTGSSKKYSIPFKGGSDRTSIIFQSYRTSRREDGIFCGPVIDDVVLHSSGALGHNFPVAVFLVLALVHLAWF